MALTVGLPAAIGAQLLLDGAISLKGVQLPTTPDVYGPILRKLEAENIKCVERVERY